MPGTLSWLDANNNKAYLDGQVSWTINGISVYYESAVWPVCEMTEDATLGRALELASAESSDDATP